VPVERAYPDAGQVGNLLRGRIHARRAEDRFRGLEQGVNIALRVGTQPPRRALGRARTR
jgi:hypothetical protein